jgi:Ca-activated chloride channel homolog
MTRTLNTIHDEMMPERDDEAGFGCLETARGCLPLISMDVAAAISGLLAETSVRQTFRNSLDEPLEATYIFPLPDRAAVTSFRMRVGDRIVEGQLKERSQARKDYKKAIEDGHRAALAEEDRSGTFSIQVGNIPPQEDVSVELTLVGPLPLVNGEATFRFPLVVAPRYTSGIPLDGPSVGLGQANDTNEVPDASRVTPPVLLPGFQNPVALTLEVELDPKGLLAAEDPEQQFSVSLHSVIVEEGPPWKIRLQPGERLNRDFILRIPMAAESVQTSLITSPDESRKSETFALTLVPPAIEPGTQAPRDVVIVLDRSGSMHGWKMVAARRAAGRIVDSLLDEDRFSVIAFDNAVEQPLHATGKLCPASDRNRWRTLEWLAKIDSRGGTEMAGAMAEAVRLLHSISEERQPILILITDGQVAGEDAILRTLKQQSPNGRIPRIHAIGIDRAVNAGFLQRLADAGDGTCDLVESEDRLDAAMDHIHRGIATVALSDLNVEAISGSLIKDSLAPARLPDLFADRPITIFGQCKTNGSSLRIHISGIGVNGRPWQAEVTTTAGPPGTIRSLWGRARVRDLEDRYAMGVEKPKPLAKEIVKVSLVTNVLSRFTAYVAVDRSEVVNKGGKQRKVVQPVEIPDGWRTDGPRMDFCCSSRDVEGDAYSLSACRSTFEDDTSESCESLLQELDDRSARPGGARLRKSAGSIPFGAEPEPKTLEEIVAEIRKLSASVRDGLMSRMRTRRFRLERLLELLRTVSTMIDSEAAEAQQRVLESIRRIEELLEEYKQGNTQVLKAATLNTCFVEVQEALGEIGTRSGETRKEFWT